MQQVRINQEPVPEIGSRGRGEPPFIVRTDLSTLMSEYKNSQRRCNDRLEFLEREMATLKGHVDQAFSSSDEYELNRTFTTKKSPVSKPTSARVSSPSRIPVPITPRKGSNNDKPVVPTTDTSTSRTLPSLQMTRSKTFHNGTSNSTTDETNFLRSYKTHLEQIFDKDVSTYSDIKIPNYASVEDVIKSNEQLLIENDRLRSELNRLKTESILLLRSIKTQQGNEPNTGNERIAAERERQELTMQLAQQVEENKRLRKSLLAQSTKFLTLRQSTNSSDVPLSTSDDHRHTPESGTRSFPNSSRNPQTKSARFNLNHRSFTRSKTFHHTSNEPS